MSAPEVHLPDWLLAALAGVLGGSVRQLTRPEESWTRRIVVSLAGGVTAVYGTPIVAPIVTHYLTDLSVPAEGVPGGVGFVLGAIGLTLIEGAIRLARQWRDNPRLPGGRGRDKT